ncbi:MarR family winged helix-turn-helix transcriptional regulator [Cellulomonas iranensis]|uniref:MarR family winged helix-turn-helix transcriptional regulator n=1 Tax=Cellulomonas iranensis TaxID=76862 RepID=UPI0015C65167|nr:MarR family transcriptional regulator [Cellulomonas iranensis]
MLETTAGQLNSSATRILRWLGVVDRRAGLTPARLSALSVLVFGGPTTLGRLAASEDVAGPTMTRIVDGLEALGLARRDAHPDDARAVLVSATADGDQLLRRAASARIATIDVALDRLSPDDRDALGRAGPAMLRLVDALAETVGRDRRA